MSDHRDLINMVDAEIKSQREALVELCGKLVAAPSQSPPGRTVEVADIVETFLRQAGLNTRIAACDPEAPNVVAHFGKPKGAHVVFNAHMDTMQPGEETKWSVPIRRLTRQDGKLYGLGMGNMKAGLAAMCLACRVLSEHREALAGQLTMTAVCDEVMFGDRGAVYLLQACPDVRGDYLISGEGPGFMQLAPAEKGLLWLDIEANSEGGHSSRALRGETAAIKLARVLTRIDEINDMYSEFPPDLNGITAGAENAGLRVSINTGTVEVGGVRSLVASRATAEIDVRLPPGVSSAEIEESIRREAAAIDSNIKVVKIKAWEASWTTPANPVVTELSAAALHIRGRAPDCVVRLPGSDARQWRNSGVPSACYGPQPLMSAGVDDFVYEEATLDCARIYARAALRLMQEPEEASFRSP